MDKKIVGHDAQVHDHPDLVHDGITYYTTCYINISSLYGNGRTANGSEHRDLVEECLFPKDGRTTNGQRKLWARSFII